MGWVEAPGGQHECRCLLERRAASAVPARYAKAQFCDFERETQAAVRLWLDSPGDGLLLTGDVGRGKTHLAAAIVRHAILTRRRARFLRAADLYAEIRKCYGENESELTLLESLTDVPLLALDDLGAGSLSDHERRVTLEVLDRRLNARKPAVVTSNWTLDEIAARLDDRVASRLAGMARLELRGDDRRLAEIGGGA